MKNIWRKVYKRPERLIYLIVKCKSCSDLNLKRSEQFWLVYAGEGRGYALLACIDLIFFFFRLFVFHRVILTLYIQFVNLHQVYE